MGFMDAVKHVYSNYVNFQGRASRAEFWWFYLFYFIVYAVLAAVGYAIGVEGLLAGLFALGSILPGLAVTVRRLHDTGHSGWWILLNLLNFLLALGFLILLFMSYIRPSEGPNQYGPPAGQTKDPVTPPEV